MLIISESLARELVSVQEAVECVEATFAAMARGDARNYPVVREALGRHDAVFGVKTGCDLSAPFLGLKAGGYWPNNAECGLGNHQSSTLLFDPSTGRASALVSANYLTGVRTGASSAIATRWLAREDASILGIIGTGGQARYQLEANLAVRSFRGVRAWDPSAQNLARFGETVEGLGLEFRSETSPERVAGSADVLVTITPSHKALFGQDCIRPGTHINAMGCDTKGKQELDPELVAGSAVFVDEVSQSVSIGELQHAVAAGLIGEGDIRGSIGEVVAGSKIGRRTNEEVTLFDGTGVALQDLVVAALAVGVAEKKGVGQRVEY